MDLFQLGQFALHSGAENDFKIECDALTDGDVRALAAELAKRLPPFGMVEHCGGASERLALALLDHRVNHRRLVLVDDVFTTGATMEKRRGEVNWSAEAGDMGAVVFARGPVPEWIVALFQMSPIQVELSDE